MGEDIHCKWYIKSKVGSKEGKYVSAIEAMPTFSTSAEEGFCEIIAERNYDLFSAFGSNMSDWRPLQGLKAGLPAWHAAEFPTENAVIKLKSNNYYKYGWTTLNDLIHALTARLAELSDPVTYYSSETDEDLKKQMLFLLTEDKNTDEGYTFIRNWKTSTESLRNAIYRLLQRLKRIQSTYTEPDYSAIFDVDESVVLFWFDR